MADRDKVICDLQILRTWLAVDPIYGIGLTPRECEMAVGWLDDAIALLKAQEPRLLTLEEIKEGEPYWFGAGKEFVTRPVICVHREDDAQKPYIMFVWKLGTFSYRSEDYGKTWRVWSAKPTDQEREAVDWDG